MNEKEILNIVTDLEDNREYKEALKYLDMILINNPDSYHALFLKRKIYGYLLVEMKAIFWIMLSIYIYIHLPTIKVKLTANL